MYQNHPEFVQPDEPETIIWRYRPYDFFISILEKQSLYFSSILKMRDKNDGKEGRFPARNIKDYSNAVEQSIIQQPENEEGIRLATKIIQEQWNGMPEKLSLPFKVANCWNMNEDEDTNMWREYAEKGIAIKTTFSRLTKSFDKTQNKLCYPDGTEVPIYAGKVNHINRGQQRISDDPVGWHLVLQKEVRDFQDERELRVASEFLPLCYGLSLNLEE